MTLRDLKMANEYILRIWLLGRIRRLIILRDCKLLGAIYGGIFLCRDILLCPSNHYKGHVEYDSLCYVYQDSNMGQQNKNFF